MSTDTVPEIMIAIRIKFTCVKSRASIIVSLSLRDVLDGMFDDKLWTNHVRVLNPEWRENIRIDFIVIDLPTRFFHDVAQF